MAAKKNLHGKIDETEAEAAEKKTTVTMQAFGCTGNVAVTLENGEQFAATVDAAGRVEVPQEFVAAMQAHGFKVESH